MKSFLALFCCVFFFAAHARNQTFEKLAAVNQYWQSQQDINEAELPTFAARTEREWISAHLSLVESKLRSRSTAHLSADQKHKRKLCLDYLNGYWHTGAFPVNKDYRYRTPIFID